MKDLIPCPPSACRGVRPFIRWAGSKRQLLGELSKYWPGGATRYVEPFAGSACLFFHLLPSQAILGDINSELMRTYRFLQRDVERVIECLCRLPTGKKSYYRIRATPPSSLTEPEQAARFIYLNKYCFNGLYRTNQRGEFNVPFGDTKGHDVIDEENIRTAARLLSNVRLVDGDFWQTLALARAGDFAYLDPPYTISHRRGFSEYQPTPFTEADLRRLQLALFDLNARNVTFLVSYAESPEASFITDQWAWTRVRTRRNIAGFASSRGNTNEILATNANRRSELGQS